MNYPKVSIIILNWNGKNDTTECLESLKKITYPNYETIIVDNGSNGDDVKALRDMFGEYIYVIENYKNYGFAEGNNIGMRYALNKGTDYILLLNNDTVVDSNFLSELVKVAESDPEIGMVGPKMYFYDEPNKIWFAGGTMNFWTAVPRCTGQGQIDRGQFNKKRETDHIPGCCILVKQETINKSGFLDKDYFAYLEDTDWCIRAKCLGYKIIYVPTATLWHKISSSTGGGYSPIKGYLKGRNTLLFMRKNAKLRHWILFPFFATLYIIRMMVREISRGNTKAVIALIKGIISNINLKVKE